MNTTIINGGLLRDKIDFLESENQALKAEVAELKEILAIEMERSYIRTELKTSRLLKQNKLERRKNRKICKELEITEQKLNQAYSLAKSPPPNAAAAAKTYALPAFCATPSATLKPPKSCRTTLPNGATAA